MDGAVVAVSHDRYFLDHVASFLFAFENGNINPYVGGYSDYLLARAASEATKPATSSDEKEKKKAARTHAQKLRFSYKEQREYETIDNDIAALEEQIALTERAITMQEAITKGLNSFLQKNPRWNRRSRKKWIDGSI